MVVKGHTEDPGKQTLDNITEEATEERTLDKVTVQTLKEMILEEEVLEDQIQTEEEGVPPVVPMF